MDTVKLNTLKSFANENNILFDKKIKIEELKELIFNNIDEEKIQKFIDENDTEKNKKWNNIINWLKEKNDGHLEDITFNSKDLKEVQKKHGGKYEARLLCKYDSSKQRPTILQELNLNIISISNGEYLLTSGQIYLSLPLPKLEIDYLLKKNIESIVLSMGDSEKSLLDNLFYARPNPFEIYTIGESLSFVNLLSGRHRTPKIEAFLNKKSITIQGSQYETDACYESTNNIILIEAKMDKSEDFNVRQIYYPYFSVLNHMKENNITKNIILLFIDYDKKSELISIHELIFSNYLHIDSCSIKSTKTFKFE